MELGYIIGWIGVLFGLLVPLPQLKRIIKGQTIEGVALGTYGFLILALLCYLVHAIYIQSLVFIVAQSINLSTNGAILFFLIRRSR